MPKPIERVVGSADLVWNKTRSPREPAPNPLGSSPYIEKRAPDQEVLDEAAEATHPVSETPRLDFEGFRDEYIEYVQGIVKEGDAYPQPAMSLDVEGVLSVHALAMSGGRVVALVKSHAGNPNVQLLAFGLDHYTRHGQNTTLGSVFTYSVIGRDGQLYHGLFEYDGQGEVIHRQIAEDEFWWTGHVKEVANPIVDLMCTPCR